MKNECSLVQELLPLYLEDGITGETRDAIEEHINSCLLCKDALEQYINTSDPIPEDVLSDPFDAKEGFKAIIIRAKKYMFRAFIGVFLIIIIISIGAFFAGRQSERAITYVGSEEDIFNYYANKVPGLKRAQREGNYQNIGKSIELPEGLGTAYFDHIWYGNEKIHVFFHINPGEGLGKIDDVEISGAMYWEKEHEGSPIRSITFSGGMHREEWISYNGMYYKDFSFQNERERFAPVNDAVAEQLKIELNITYIPKVQPFNWRQEHIDVGIIEFSAMYDPIREQASRVKVENSISIPDGITLDFQDLVLETQKSTLKFKASGLNGREIAEIQGEFIGNSDEKIRFSKWASYLGEEHYEIELQAMNNFSEEYTINLDVIQLVTDKNLTFDLDAKAFHSKMEEGGFRQTVNENLGIYAGTEYILQSLYADDRGLEFSILMKSPAFNDTISVSGPGSWAAQQRHLKRIQEEGEDISNVRRQANSVRFTNEKGEVGETKDYGQVGVGGGRQISMFIDKQFVEKSNTITVELMNLVETISGEWNSVGQ
ncbi:MAG: zf-HC2 domain-containing protein [Clostridiales bacterium]|nr:zf-HC2 domain-containing protein [Clostridiales bacterium]